MTTELMTVTCRGCQVTGEASPAATSWRCPGCRVLWTFPTCRACGRVSWVKVGDAAAWTCPQCGQGNRSVDMAAERARFQRSTARNMRLLYVGLAVMVVGVLLTLVGR